MKKGAGIFVLVIVTLVSAAQEGKISVRVMRDQQALENATVELLKLQDSSLQKVTLTDGSGQAQFEKVPFGKYIIRFTAVNYQSQYSPVFELTEQKKELSLP